MQFQDIPLTCTECGAEFNFTAGEQAFFHEKGLTNQPRRCTDCRILMRARKQGKEETVMTVKCDQCGIDTRVPFKPTGKAPVLCMKCLHEARSTVTTR